MDALTVMTAPTSAAAAKGGLANAVDDLPQGQSFGQVLAQQGAAQPADDVAGSDAAGQRPQPQDPSEAAAAEQTPDAQSPLDEPDDQTGQLPSAAAAAAGAEEASDDAGRVAAAAALLQWLSVAPQGVEPEVAQAAASQTLPATQASAANAAGADLQSGTASLPAAASSVQPLPAADLQHNETGSQSQAQQSAPMELQASPAPVTNGFQSLLGQTAPLTQTAPPAMATADLPRAALEAPVGNHAWAEELGTRLAVMTARGEQTGSLKLNPEHLGPLEVQIRVQDDKASVVFGAQHADTRTALHEALPRLREMFAASGLQLTDAGVSREGARQAPPIRVPRTLLGGTTEEAGGIDASAVRVSLRHAGMIDAVA